MGLMIYLRFYSVKRIRFNVISIEFVVTIVVLIRCIKFVYFEHRLDALNPLIN
jgi:hypothetical protein